ncbi:hypothetical protein SPHINGO8BC_60712 [Sphingobacterium multivorum]|uniref:Uncharacterized protein n=1 Tax=Sphingobacterium multivorum TaxID=28454 RepID=A0A654DIS9_SPHMU|nr:hypothetical protein SPHINGO8BC_60712 [Sphingobacterium multivorum]
MSTLRRIINTKIVHITAGILAFQSQNILTTPSTEHSIYISS